MRKVLLITAVVLISSGIALADTITFSGISSNAGGNPVNAQAVVTTGNGTVTIALSNLQGNFANAGQLLSDFSVDLSDSSTATPTVTSNGNLINVGSFKDTPPGQVTSAGTGASGWNSAFAAGIPSGESISLDGLNGAANTPSHLVIGAACAGGNYCDAKGSIAGNGPHNPFYQGPLTFSLTNFTGITSSTTASNAVFSFGTTSGVNVNGTVVPEPASLLLFGTGLLGLGLIVRRKFARAA